MKFFLSICVFLIAQSCSAQNNDDRSRGLFRKNRSWMATLGYTNQNQNVIELGIKSTSLSEFSNGDAQEIMKYLGYGYLIYGAEITLGEKVQAAPKLGIGTSLALLNFNINMIGYNDRFNSFYPAIVPEIGLSILGIVQINYGYNIYLSKPNPIDLYTHRISFRLNWFIKDQYWHGDKKD